MEKYAKGTASDEERFELEKQALDDPLLFEAMEGFHLSNPEDSFERVNKLTAVIAKKTEGQEQKLFPFFIRVAAAVIILISFVFVTRQFMNETETNQKDLVSNEEQIIREETALVEPSYDVEKDSSLLAANENYSERNIPSESKHEQPSRKNEKIKKPLSASKDVQFKTHQNSAVDFENKSENEPTLPKKSNKIIDGVAMEKEEMQTTGQASARVVKDQVSEGEISELAITQIYGKVTDLENNEPLIGATVQIQGTEIATLTDIDGKYQLAVPFKSPHIQFLYVGYEVKDYDLQGVNEVNVALKPSITFLEEAVVAPLRIRIQHTDEGNISVGPVMGWLQLERFIEENLYRYLSPGEQIQISEDSTDILYKGSVELEFRVTNLGTLKDFKVLNSTCKACEERAIQLLKRSGHWETNPEGEEVITKITVLF